MNTISNDDDDGDDDVVIDMKTETKRKRRESVVISNKTFDNEKEDASLKIHNRRKSFAGHIITTNDEKQQQQQKHGHGNGNDQEYKCNDILYSSNGHIIGGHCHPSSSSQSSQSHNHMLSGLIDNGVVPVSMDRLHYPVMHPNMPGISNYSSSSYRPMLPFNKRGKPRFEYGCYTQTNFWIPSGRGGGGGGCFRYSNYRMPYFPRNHRSYLFRGATTVNNHHQKIPPMARDSLSSTQITPVKKLL